MKKLIMLLIATLLINVVSAKELKPKKTYTSTTLEISELLNSSSQVGILEEDQKVKVKVMLNTEKEIIVLVTNSSNKELTEYIKEKLNFKKLKSTELEVGSSFEFLVNFKA